GSRYAEINKRISAWVNKHKEFPDYCDILNLVKKVTKDSLLPLRPETVRVQAQDIFREVGKMLKDRRESDDLEIFYSRADDALEDPGSKDEDLDRKLAENEEVAREKIDKVFQDWVEKESEWRENQDTEASKKNKSPKKGTTKSDVDGAENNKNENVDDEQDDEQDEQDDEQDDDGDDEVSLPDLEADFKDEDEDEEDDDIDTVIESANNVDTEEEDEEEDQDDLSEEDVPILDSEELDAIAMETNSGEKRKLEDSEESVNRKKICEDNSS
ncbi:unnamed protein product, partial [Meganyctiphanes norvegica]